MDDFTHNEQSELIKRRKNHFVICLYAAIYRLLHYIGQLNQVGGPTLDAMFTKYPFLKKYEEEMLKYMPELSSFTEGNNWWEKEIHHGQNKLDDNLPLQRLHSELNFNTNNILAFIIVGLIEEDSRFGTLFLELQAPLNYRRPSLEIIGQIVTNANTDDAWTACRPMVNAGLVDIQNQQAPRSEWILRIPPILWDAARGFIDNQNDSLRIYQDLNNLPGIAELIYPNDFLIKIKNIPKLLAQNDVCRLILRGDQGSDPVEIIGAVAQKINTGIVVVDAEITTNFDEQHPHLGALCTMSHCLPVIRFDLGPGDTLKVPILRGYQGPLCIVLGIEGGIDGHNSEKTLTVNLPLIDKELRQKYWRRELNGYDIEDLDAVTDLFHLSGDYIRQVSGMAKTNAVLNGRSILNLQDVQEASRSLNRQRLDTLADRLDAKGAWESFVATNGTIDKLAELEHRCRYREKILDHLSDVYSSNINRGVRALFMGASGTGKTMAAKILAAELGLDIYRVDLAAIINKYIGETEKNLHKVLAHAEALDVVLLLDEGDALLGSRTDVKSSNDRYANLETNYLLQRLENYQGIVVVTTNLGENIDSAFQRRMDVVVPFFAPRAEQRWQILQLHLPLDHEVDMNYLDQVAIRCQLTGGQIRNAVLHAGLLALKDDEAVNEHHIEKALRSEYRKAGATFPLLDNDRNSVAQDNGVEAFMNAISNQ